MKSISTHLCILLFIFFFQIGFAQPDYLDPSFGGDGKVLTRLSSNEDRAYSILTQSDGKILVSGFSFDINTSGVTTGVLLIRYNSDGSIDESFGDNGKVISNHLEPNEIIKTLGIQDNGKILIAGQSKSNFNNIAIERYDPSGKIDLFFGDNGIKIIDSGGRTDLVKTLFVQPNNQILIGGNSQDGTSSSSCLIIRLEQDGSFNSTFGDNGKVYLDFRGGLTTLTSRDDKIIVGGDTFRDSTKADFAILQFNSNGTLDEDFGINGIMSFDFFKDYDIIGAIKIQDDKKILVGGYATVPGAARSDYALARINSDGTPDITFGNNGKVSIGYDSNTELITSIELQADGKILGIGGFVTPSPTSGNFITLRFNSDGTLDTEFGDNGNFQTSFNSYYDYAYSSVKLSDTEYLLSGTSQYRSDNRVEIALTKYKINDAVFVEKKLNNSFVKIFPNPASDLCLIEFNKLMLGNIQIDLFDSKGVLLKTEKRSGEKIIQFDLKNLSSGSYSIRINTGLEIFIEKIILK